MGHNRNLADYAHHFDGTHIDLGSGNIETQGVLTYEDVTNVDAIGIITARAGVKVPDNQKVFLGTGDDLQIYHNGTHSYIHNDTGNLRIESDSSNNNDIQILNNNTTAISNHSFSYSAKFISGGSVELYEAGSKKFETTTTGATVTGTLVSDGVTSELDLSAISASISDTATDIFVYDTRKDSDGGAWRKRTQHTSWYNETLGTSTRGTRREFPAVAVIVAEQNFIRIYDGDDPDLPMWMVFNTIASGVSQGMAGRPMIQVQNTDKVVYALNGILATGTKNESSNYGQPIINFISEKVLRMDSQGGEGGEWMGTIAQRNEAIGYRSVDYDYVIPASRVNDISMTVLPNAPIDDATGLPVPTIAVATDSGISIIKDDGTVINSSTNTSYAIHEISIFSSGELYHRQGSGSNEGVCFNNPYTRISGINLGTYANSSTFWYATDGIGNSSNYLGYSSVSPNAITTPTQSSLNIGDNRGLTFVDVNKSSLNSGMSAYATTSYNTGWMHGDIKGAFLSDTDTTNVTYTTVLDDWATAAAWTKQSSISLTSTGSGTSGTVSITGNGTGSNVYFFNAITVEANTDYVMTVNFGAYNANEFYINDNPYSTANKLINIHALSGLTRGGHFNSGSNTTLYIQGYQVSTTATTITNVVVQKVSEKDRSVNNKGLQVYGTVTKSAVATGADLVGYSGFNGNNYLRQPHNADLNVGTGDFYIMCWAKGNRYMLWHRKDGGSLDMRCEFPTSGGSANRPRFLMSNGGVTLSFFATYAFDTTTWHHCVWVKRGARNGELYIDGVLNNSGTAGSDLNLNGTDTTFSIGNRADNPTEDFNGYVSLFRFGASAPSAEQVKKIYNDEKHLFQENAKATLYGSSDAVTALAYDEDTELLHVGTSAGRSDFQGLRRINNTTTAVTTAISASDDLIAEQ